MVDIKPFQLERFFDKWEFKAEVLLCCSDVEPLTLKEILAHADADDLERWDQLALGYTMSCGLDTLRQHIAKAFYTEATESDINVCVPEEGIYLSMLTLLKPGDEVVCTLPAYQSLHSIAESLQCKVHDWNPKQDEGGLLRFDVQDALDALASNPKVKLVVVNVPHNPTGLTLRRADLHSLVDACKGAGSYLFMDEMYKFLELEHGEEGPLPSACDVYERGITLCGLSKSFASPGLRIGWIACRDAAFMKSFAMLKDYTTICPPTPCECLAIMVIKQRDWIVKRSLDLIRTNAAALKAFCDAHADCIDFYAPQAGSIVFPRIRIPGMGGATAFCEAFVKEQNTLLLPASVYEGPMAEEDDRVRFGLGRDPEKTKEGLRRLGQFFDAHTKNAATA